MNVTGDVRLDDVPMVPVTCSACRARVLVRKSSWNQTSVQWDSESSTRCVERQQISALSPHDSRGVFLACSAIRDSIVDAVRAGDVRVVDEIATPAT